MKPNLHCYPSKFKVVPYSVWMSKFVLTILAVFLSIGQIVGELELPPLNINTKQFSLYGTTLRFWRHLQNFVLVFFSTIGPELLSCLLL